MRRFDTLLPSLADNRGDAVIASIAVTPETRKRVDFSDPYYRTPARFVARRDVALQRRAARAARGQEGRGGRPAPRTRPISRRCSPRRSCGPIRHAEAAREALRKGEVDLLFGDGISLAFWLNGTDSAELLRLSRRAVHREPLFRRRRRHRGQARQRHAAAGVQLGAVPAVGKGPLQRSVAALFPDQPVLIGVLTRLTRRRRFL